jgi:V8-like Glu-specific endopeptidase
MKLISLTLLGLLAINNSFAMPIAKINALNTLKSNFDKLDPNYDFNGIVKLSNCSGSIIKFSGMPETAKAIAMTNGHCYGNLIDPNTKILNQDINRSMKVYNKDQKLVSISAVKVLYATMTNTDITLYELKSTYAELSKKGVDAFELDTNHPNIGESMDIVSGYWDRGYRCNIDSFIYQLRESDWTMKDSIRYSENGCNTIGGTSGSPIIQTGTRNVIGINNTGNESGERCTMDNPCEVDEHGNIAVKIHASYGQETYNIYTCLSLDFRIDLAKPGCELFK